MRVLYVRATICHSGLEFVETGYVDGYLYLVDDYPGIFRQSLYDRHKELDASAPMAHEHHDTYQVEQLHHDTRQTEEL